MSGAVFNKKRRSMECKDIIEMLPAYQEGGLQDAAGLALEAHLQVCKACRNVQKGLFDSWRLLETWEDSEPPERVMTTILSRISRQRKLFWWKVALPAAAVLLIVFGAIFRFAEWESKKPQEVRGPVQLSAERPDIDVEELIANLHILQNEEFFDALEELVKIDYLPLLEEPDQLPAEHERSSLEMLCS
jgi:hypothetical protein